MNAHAALWLMVLLASSAAACSCNQGAGPTGATPIATVTPALAGSRVDALLHAAWEREHLVPTALADDATFLRRVTLDLWGSLPSPAELAAFLADAAADKRARLVDRLLADARFSDRFAVTWTDTLLGESGPKDGVDRAAFRSWLEHRMEERAPWDAVVRELIAGKGTSSPGGTVAERSILAHAPRAEPFDAKIQGSTNYLLRYRASVEDLTGKTSRAFLGIQIQCTQCHDHKTEAWTMAQFKSFAAAFIQTRAVADKDRDKGDIRVFEVKDLPRAKLGPKATDAQKAIAAAPPRALDGTALDGAARRKALADWITDRKNPTFARAFVNRTWASLLGSGFVEPVDDFRPGNKPVLPELLDALAEGFAAGGHDVRGLFRAVCLSEAYQRSAGPPGKLWSSFALRPLPAVLLFDAVIAAASLGPVVEEVMGEKAELVRARTRQRFVLVLDVDEDAGTHRFEGSIAQALLLSNGTVSRVAARAVDGSALLALLRSPGSDDAKIDTLYQRTLSRSASPEERAQWRRFLDEPAPATDEAPRVSSPNDPLARLDKRLASRARDARERAYEDLFWALLNSSEMAMQH